MTPLEYRYTAFLVTLGILSPIIIFVITITIYGISKEIIQKREDRYRRYMNPEYWFVRKVEQAPNPDYIQVHIENSASKEIICHGIEKKRLTGLVK